MLGGEFAIDGEFRGGMLALPAFRLYARLAKRATVDANRRGCWRWRGYHDKDGYARCKWQGENIPVARAIILALCSWTGPHHDAHHECRNAWCVNPDHISPVERLTHYALHRRYTGDGSASS